MAISFRRVTETPETLAASTVYLVGDAGEGATGDLEIVVTDSTGTKVRSTPTATQITNMINNSIGDLAGAPVYAADIEARDDIDWQGKNGLVLVADATDDDTVASGAALYFYREGDGDDSGYFKVAEYESMDLVIPNADILADLSDIGGKLGYKGALVTTVYEGEHQW